MEQLIIKSDLYQKAIQVIKDRTNISIDLEYNDILNEWDDMSRLEKAQLLVVDIEKILESDYSTIIEFSIKKLLKFDNEKIEEEYPVGEEVDNEDEDEYEYEYPVGEEVDNEDEDEISGVYVVDFLLYSLIEYYFLKNDPSNLLGYLKSVGIPYAKKYEKDLKGIYNQIQLTEEGLKFYNYGIRKWRQKYDMAKDGEKVINDFAFYRKEAERISGKAK